MSIDHLTDAIEEEPAQRWKAENGSKLNDKLRICKKCCEENTDENISKHYI